MNNRILIAGGAGFIGTHLTKKYLDKGFDVIVLDNLSTGRAKNLEPFFSLPNFYFYKMDIENQPNLEFLGPIDYVVNLACPASPIHYQKNPVKTFRTCIIGTENLLRLAKTFNAVFLQASTSEIYGDPLKSPQNEEDWGNVNPIGPRSCYDEGKRASETLIMDYHNQYQVRTKIMRIFNTYGPYMDKGDGRVVSNFICQALRGEDLTIYGDGSQTRSFQYIDDLINAIERLLNTDDDFIGPVNLGNPDEFTIKELAEKVLHITGKDNKLIYKDLPQDDPKQRKPDIDLANRKLDWRPVVKLDEGLVKTIHYFKKEIKNG